MDDMKASELLRATIESPYYRPGRRSVAGPGSKFLCIAMVDYYNDTFPDTGLAGVDLPARLVAVGKINDAIYPHETLQGMWWGEHECVPGWAERLTFWDHLVRKLEEQGL